MQKAVESQNIEMVKCLLKSPTIDPNILCTYNKNKINYTAAPLHAAVENENIEIVKLLLLNEKINVNLVLKIEKESFGEYKYNEGTALHIAIEKTNSEIVKILLQNKNIDVNIPYHSYYKFRETDYSCSETDDAEYHEPTLIHALSRNNLEIIKLLLEHKELNINSCFKKTYESTSTSGIRVSNSNYEMEYTPLYFAIDSECNVDIVKILLENDKINVNAPYRKNSNPHDVKYHKLIVDYPLHSAVKHGKIEEVKLLLQHKNIIVIKVDGSGKKPIDYADKNEEIRQLLMNYT